MLHFLPLTKKVTKTKPVSSDIAHTFKNLALLIIQMLMSFSRFFTNSEIFVIMHITVPPPEIYTKFSRSCQTQQKQLHFQTRF